MSGSRNHGTGANAGAGILLGMMLALACCIAIGGMLVARREVEARQGRDRQPQRALAGAMQVEVLKLETLYEGHLKRLGGQLMQSSQDKEVSRQAARKIEGIQRVSWLSVKSGVESHLSLDIRPEAAAMLPEPTLEKKQPGLPRPRVLLDMGTLFRPEVERSSLWIDEPGKPLMFAVQEFDRAVVFTIDRAEVATAMRRHFEIWLPGRFAAVEQMGGPDAVQDAQGVSIRSVGSLPAHQPDVLAPVVSRFGTWHLASWDERVLRVAYHLPTLGGSLALALLVAGCGIRLSAQQRRAALLARQRVSFVNRVSHELRTPMTNILLNLDVIEDAVPEAVGGRFALVREEAGRLGRLIENVLVFSKQERGCLGRRVSVLAKPAEVVDGITRQFEPALERRGIQITRLHEGPVVKTIMDSDALAQVTANLLSNVEKYAPNAAVEVRTEQREKDFVLTVTDAGPGIPTADVEHIFEPFFRVDDRVEAGVSGAGLGLSISRELAQMMGGELRLVPVEKGACFELRMPLTGPAISDEN